MLSEQRIYEVLFDLEYVRFIQLLERIYIEIKESLGNT